MQSHQPCCDFYRRQMDIFDPFSLYFWDEFPDFGFRLPLMMPPPPRPQPSLFMSNMEPRIRSKIEHKETPEAHVFTAELPGIKKEDVNVHVDDAKVLHISARSKHEKEERNDSHYHHVERGFGEFVSRFKLPHNCRPEHLRSCVKNGFLTVTVPKVHMVENHNHHHNNLQYY